jgi:ATP-dependent DNA helicase UvrD/PcrA
MIMPQRFYTHHRARTGDRHVFAGRSRFIPGALAHRFNRRKRMSGMWSKIG